MIIPEEKWSTIIPNLQIQGLIAEGGMGAVYRAKQVSLDREIALKVIASDGGAYGANTIELFQREARVMAQLDQPNIVKVHDFGTAEGLLYLMMELVKGGSVHDRMVAGTFQPKDSIAIFRQACQGLAFAHKNGIIHHDIKPSNVMVQANGIVKLVDFGLAQIRGGDSSSPQFGTPGYAAPERSAEGGVIDHRADIYSMGALLHEMLTGAPPAGPGPVAPGSIPHYPEIAPVMTRCLTEDPANRFQNVPSLLIAFNNALGATEAASASAAAGAALKSAPGGSKSAGSASSGAGSDGAKKLDTAPKKKSGRKSLSTTVKEPTTIAKTKAPSEVAGPVTVAAGGKSVAATASGTSMSEIRERQRQTEEKAALMKKAVLWGVLFCAFVFGVILFFSYQSQQAALRAKRERDNAPPPPKPEPVVVEPAVPVDPPEPVEPPKPGEPGWVYVGDDTQFAFHSHVIPGTLQLEFFDTGGPGIAFQDSDGPEGSSNMRPEADRDVDIALADDIGGGHVIEKTAEGEWLEYTIEKAEAGTYSVAVRYSSDGSGDCPIALTLNGVPFADFILPTTSGQPGDFVTHTVGGIEIREGTNLVLQVAIGAPGYNLNFIEFTQ